MIAVTKGGISVNNSEIASLKNENSTWLKYIKSHTGNCSGSVGFSENVHANKIFPFLYARFLLFLSKMTSDIYFSEGIMMMYFQGLGV